MEEPIDVVTVVEQRVVVDVLGVGASGMALSALLDGYVKGNGAGVFTAAATVPWGDVSSTPTTLGGYGILDAYTKSAANALFAVIATTLAGYGITDAYTKTQSDARYAAVATTLAGYGITDAYTKTQSDALYAAVATTLAGYGITDAYTKVASDARFAPIAVPWASLTGVPTTVAGYGISDVYTKTAGDARYAPIAVPWASLTGVPTTVGGYGITDVYTKTAGDARYQPLDSDLTALAALSAGGIAVQTSVGSWAQRTLTGTTSRVAVTNGSGVSGNPTIDIDSAYVGQASITTVGTVATGVWNAGAVTSSGAIQAASASTLGISTDVLLNRDGANILALRSGTTAQTLRVANTFTSASVNEYGVFDWSTTLNTLTIGAQAAGTGTLRAVSLVGASYTVNGSSTNNSVKIFKVVNSTPADIITVTGDGRVFIGSNNGNDVVFSVDMSGAKTTGTAMRIADASGNVLMGSLGFTSSAANFTFGSNNFGSAIQMVAPAGNGMLRINAGNTTIGQQSLGGTPDKTLKVFNAVATTGVTSMFVQEGAGQSTTEVFGVYANDGTTFRFKVVNGAVSAATSVTAPTFVATGLITSSGATSGIGYATGAGGTVAQATSKSTGVTLNKVCGQITLNAAALAAGAIVSFTLTNSAIAATDVVELQHQGTGTGGAYGLNAQSAAGSAVINVRNNTAGSLSEAIVISFVVIKGVTA